MLGALTLDQLRILITVAETGSFSAAGRRLGRVQSSISQSVQALERQLRLELFDRSTKTPKLTDVGRSILSRAADVIARTEELEAHAGAMASGVEPELTIATDSIFPRGPLAASLRALEQIFAYLPVTLYTEQIGAAERRIREGTAQIGLYSYPLHPALDLEGRPLVEIPLIPVVSADHPLAKLDRLVDRNDLESYVQLIITDGLAGPSTSGNGVISPKIWRFADLARRLDFLLEGLGWGSMPVHMVSHLIATGRLAEIRLADRQLTLVKIPIYAVHLRGKPPGTAGRWLIDDLAARLADTALGASPRPEITADA
jgi:DNA-binding transcriptional LysR family regulator